MSLQELIQCLTRDLILSANTESATVCPDGDCTVQVICDAFPILSIAADSCDLDKYDMPVRSRKVGDRKVNSSFQSKATLAAKGMQEKTVTTIIKKEYNESN